MRTLPLMFALLGCAAVPKTCPDPEENSWTQEVFELDTTNGQTIKAQLHPSTAPAQDWPTPMVVFVQGGWGSDPLPITQTDPQLRSDLGFSVLYLELPTEDRRGAASRAALAAGLRHASSLGAPMAGCPSSNDPEQRVPVLLAGFSNGGNLAWATLADPDQNLPPIAGIATFETPPSSQFVALDPGSLTRPNDRFDADDCHVENSEIVCEIDYTPLIAGTAADCGGQDGCLAIDANHDGVINAPEFVLGVLNDPGSGMRVASIQATALAQTTGVLPDDFMDTDAVNAFWAARVGADILKAAAARHPDLAAIVTGTEGDHMLTSLTRPVHLTAFAQAIAQAGTRWIRLHPDAEYMRAMHGDVLPWRDNPANDGTDLSDPMLTAEPEETHDVHPTDYLNAAVLELIDRSTSGDWSNDLDKTIRVVL